MAGGALLAMKLYPNLMLRLAHCPLRDTTGVPCPTCGGTHAAASLATGDWLGALSYNPVVVLGLVGFAIWALYSVAATLVPVWRRSLQLDAGDKKAARWLAALLFIFAWVWQFFRVF
jgi:hypothetical protein